jgi:agmatine deiminase
MTNMMKMKKCMSLVLSLLSFIVIACEQEEPVKSTRKSEVKYLFPEESSEHEATWLQWPHHYQYGKTYRNRLDATWVEITKALVESEKLKLIVYNNTEKQRVIELLKNRGVDLGSVEFHIYKTDDVWIRDNGPIYVQDEEGNLCIQDWGFNGWGNKADFENCDKIPELIAKDENRKYVNIGGQMINEGGSVEVDGYGTMLACKSSILNENRNPGMSQLEAENIFRKYYGVTNFIWLEGQAGLDITDQHIDGFARFANAETIVCMNKADLAYYDVKDSDIEILYGAKNAKGDAYEFVYLPLTKEDVYTSYGKNVGKASYCNYYIANNKVLIPVYKDENDALALKIIQGLYPEREVVGIDCRNLYVNGGMIHCVTQQEPKE